MLHDVPETWELKPLSDLADYHNGRAFKPEDWTDQGLPIVRIAQINDPDAEYDYYAGKDVEPRHLINDGDILFSWSATLTAIKWSRGPGILNQHIFKVVPRLGIDRDFLLYTILNSIDVLAGHSHGSTMKHIKKGVLKLHQVPVPPLSEQCRIGEILSSVDEAIQATQAVIEQTRKVKRGVLGRLLTRGIGHTRFRQTEIGEIPETWGLGKLRDVSCHITSGSRGWAQYYTDEGALFVRSQNIRDGVLDFADRQHVRVPTNAEGARTLVCPDDLLFTITGNGVGNVAKVPNGLGPAYVSQHIGLVRLNEPDLADLFVAFFSPSGPGNVQITGSQYGQSKPGLSLENIRQFVVPIPPPTEARRIIAMIRDFTTAEMIAIDHSSHLSALKSGLMSDLLTGRKRASDHLLMAAE